MSDLRPLKIAILTSFPLDFTVGSGVVRMILGYAAAFQKAGHHVQIFHPSFRSVSYLNLALQRLQFNRALAAQRFEEFDLVIGSDFDGYALKRLAAPKVVLNAGILADIIRFERGKIARILQHLARRECQNVQSADLTVVPSHYTARRLHQLYKTPASRIAVVPLGIDLEQWRQWKKACQPPSLKETVILSVARQYPRKGIKDLILAFQKTIARVDNVRLIVVGGGPQAEANRLLARQLNLTGKITFVGDLKDQTRLAGYYRRAHIFCLPSYHETFGLVFLEAMYFGLPIVAYASTAIPEVVTPEQGLLCPAGDIDSLSEKLLTLIGSAKLRNKMGASGKERVKQFSWQNSAAKLLKRANFSGNR